MRQRVSAVHASAYLSKQQLPPLCLLCLLATFILLTALSSAPALRIVCLPYGSVCPPSSSYRDVFLDVTYLFLVGGGCVVVLIEALGDMDGFVDPNTLPFLGLFDDEGPYSSLS